MNILFDVNIWVDVAIRGSTYPGSRSLFEEAISSSHAVFLPACGYTTIYYLISRYSSSAGGKDFLGGLFQLGVLFAPFTDQTIILANQLALPDFEDSCVAASASLSRCKLIVSRDKRGFRKSPVKTITPEQVLKELF